MDYKELLAQAKAKAEEAKALLAGVSPDMTKANGLIQEVQRLREQAEALKAATTILDQIGAPVLPAPLPAGNEPGGTGKDPNAAIKALATLRFGEPEAAVGQILRELHGVDYETKRWKQWMTFNRWLRDYTSPAIPAEGREFLWTPKTIKLALQEGQDVTAMKAVMVEAAETLGGYVVPEDYRAQIIERMMGLVAVRARATVVTTSRDAVEFPVTTGGTSQYTGAVRVTWVDETPTAGTAATNLTFGLKRLPVHTVMAETFLSRNLIEDAAFNLADYLARKFAEAAAIDEDNRFLTGDGNGKPQGILPDSANGLSLTEVITGDADELTYDGIISLTYGIDTQYLTMPSCAFIGEKATVKAIALLKDNEDRYLWDRVERQAGKLEGYPVLQQEAMPTIAANAYPLIFGDLSGYWIVDRVGMSVERYLDSSTARINQVCYVMRRRLGGQVTETWRFAVQKVSLT
jgi:HK97 family phage major capsid protein